MRGRIASFDLAAAMWQNALLYIIQARPPGQPVSSKSLTLRQVGGRGGGCGCVAGGGGVGEARGNPIHGPTSSAQERTPP